MAVKKSKKTKTAQKPRKMQIDFTGVEGKKRARRIPEGDYLMKITDWEVDHKKDDDSNKFLKIYYEIEQGPTEGKWDEIFNLGKTSLWRLRNFLEALGFKIPSKAIMVPFEKLPNKKVAMTVADDEYEGKTKSKAVDYFSAKDYEALASEDEDEEDAEEAVTSDDEDEEEEEETDEDEDEDEELELVDDEDI